MIDRIKRLAKLGEGINGLLALATIASVPLMFAIRDVAPTALEIAQRVTWHPLPFFVQWFERAEPPAATGEALRVPAPEPATAARMELSRLDMDIAIVEADLQSVSDEARADKLAQRDDLRAARSRVAAQVQALRRP
jgi:hypothetical protein